MSTSVLSLSCQQATLLLERRADEPLPAANQAQLLTHLELCPLCQRYEAQSRFLAQQARPAAEAQVPAAAQLPPTARRRLQRMVEAHAAGSSGQP